MQLGANVCHFHDACIHDNVHAHFFLLFLVIHLSSFGSDHGYRCTYGRGGHAGHDYDVCRSLPNDVIF